MFSTTRTTRPARLAAAATAALALLGSGALAVGTASSASAAPCWTLPTPPKGCVEPGEPTDPPPAPEPPVAPSSVTAPAVLQTWVSVRWADRSADEQGFRITRQNRTTGAVATFTVGADVTAFDDSTATANTAYRYYVAAFDADGDSTAPSVDVATRPQPADVIGTASGARIKGASAGYSWDYLSISGWALDFDRAGTIDVRLVHDGETVSTVAATGYTAGLNATYPGYGDNHRFDASYLPVRTSKGTHTLCAVGVSVGGGADKQLGCVTYTQAGPPSAATDLVATPKPYTVEVGFTDRADDETGWYLQRSTDAGTSWTSVTSGGAVAGVGSRTTAVDFSTYATGSGVCYRVLTVNSYGQTPSVKACL